MKRQALVLYIKKKRKGDFITGDLFNWGTAAKTNGAS